MHVAACLQEVLASTDSATHPLSVVKGRAHILSASDYKKHDVTSATDSDVYFCMWR
jgi:hypothetical protein